MLTPREMAHTLVWAKRHILRQMHEPALDIIQPHIRPDDTVVDIGAHAGSWTVRLSHLVPRGHVVAFEALPYYARVLRATLRLLGRSNIDLVAHPVLDEEKPVPMVWQDPAGHRLTGLTHVLADGEIAAATIEVESVVLDDYFADFSGTLRFIKMDIEGAELHALRGARTVLTSFQPVLFIELKTEHCARYGHTVSDVFDYLGEFDYRGFVSGQSGLLHPVDAQSYHGSGDAWFIPAGKTGSFEESSDHS